MAETKDADAAYTEIIAQMPQPLADMYWRFSNQYCWTLVKWQEFDELFITPEQVELLNRAAPAFFASLQTILFLDLVMDVGRFTDPAEMGKFRNLSLEQIEKAVPDNKLRASLGPLRSAAEERCQPVREYRNKVSAHFDRDVALGVQQEPPVCRRDLREALESIAPIPERDRAPLRRRPLRVRATPRVRWAA